MRHPGAVASSLARRFHYTFADAVSYWSTTNLDMIRSGADLGDRFTLCRYEDLVVQREPVMRDLVEFLGEPWAPQLLEHHRVQQEKGAPRAAEGSTITSDPIDPRRAVAWTSSTSSEDLDELLTVGELAKFFGYQPSDAAVRSTFAPEGRHLLEGPELARRRDAWNGRLDFDARRPALLLDAPAEELAARLSQVEQALARLRSRRAVRFTDALRRVQHGRSREDLRNAWQLLHRS